MTFSFREKNEWSTSVSGADPCAVRGTVKAGPTILNCQASYNRPCCRVNKKPLSFSGLCKAWERVRNGKGKPAVTAADRVRGDESPLIGPWRRSRPEACGKPGSVKVRRGGKR